MGPGDTALKKVHAGSHEKSDTAPSSGVYVLASRTAVEFLQLQVYVGGVQDDKRAYNSGFLDKMMSRPKGGVTVSQAKMGVSPCWPLPWPCQLGSWIAHECPALTWHFATVDSILTLPADCSADSSTAQAWRLASVLVSG
jgi:hypothetical protein